MASYTHSYSYIKTRKERKLVYKYIRSHWSLTLELVFANIKEKNRLSTSAREWKLHTKARPLVEPSPMPDKFFQPRSLRKKTISLIKTQIIAINSLIRINKSDKKHPIFKAPFYYPSLGSMFSTIIISPTHNLSKYPVV